MSAAKLIFFDCDSTLSAIEGIDEMARLRGGDCFARVETMTREAMDGKIPINEIFGRRLDLIRPTREETARVGQHYIDTIEPTALETMALLRRQGWTPIILSAGYTQAIAPLAEHLGIERIEAVNLQFDEQGNYQGFDADYPTTRNGGKPARILQIKAELLPAQTVMVGDGISDLETAGFVGLFVGFGRYVQRPKVKAGAQTFINSLLELPPLLP
ncbi:MAG: HAD-IB family phosphatase [Cephaloticoccus sp.]|nr:HAD-IB family phosphatase [Cephaloticoccus sp.]MCF7760278.1 HAD-IB family phosphatase [Cephaloticoccus sp.]